MKKLISSVCKICYGSGIVPSYGSFIQCDCQGVFLTIITDHTELLINPDKQYANIKK